jgi:hypothetical protein
MKFIPWKYLIRLGLELIQTNLLPRLKVNIHLSAFFSLVLAFAAITADKLTDSDPENGKQVKAVFLERIDALLSTLLAGVIDIVKEDDLKKKIIAILQNGIDRLS